MNYRLSAGAEADLVAAIEWYENQREGLGLEFALEFEETLVRALAMQGVGAIVGFSSRGAEIRRYRIKRFTRYSILLATFDEIPTVVAVLHSSRRPGLWRGRVR